MTLESVPEAQRPIMIVVAVAAGDRKWTEVFAKIVKIGELSYRRVGKISGLKSILSIFTSVACIEWFIRGDLR